MRKCVGVKRDERVGGMTGNVWDFLAPGKT